MKDPKIKVVTSPGSRHEHTRETTVKGFVEEINSWNRPWSIFYDGMLAEAEYEDPIYGGCCCDCETLRKEDFEDEDAYDDACSEAYAECKCICSCENNENMYFEYKRALDACDTVDKLRKFLDENSFYFGDHVITNMEE